MSTTIVVDDEAMERAQYALCRFLFPGYAVPRTEMARAVVIALAGVGDWHAELPARHAAQGENPDVLKKVYQLLGKDNVLGALNLIEAHVDEPWDP
jgi:hypothetical protein